MKSPINDFGKVSRWNPIGDFFIFNGWQPVGTGLQVSILAEVEKQKADILFLQTGVHHKSPAMSFRLTTGRSFPEMGKSARLSETKIPRTAFRFAAVTSGSAVKGRKPACYE